MEFTRKHTLSNEQLLRCVTDLAVDMADQFHLDMEWRDDLTLAFQSMKGMAKGLNGELELGREHLRMVLRLPFGLQPMAQAIADEVNEYLNKNVGRHVSQG